MVGAMSTAQAVKLSQMVDLALGTPEVGAVNFNVLHTLLHAMLTKMNMGEVMAEMDEEDHRALSQRVQPGSARSSKVHFQDDKDSVITTDSGIEAGQGVIPKKQTNYHALQDRMNSVERQLDTLNALPRNRELIDQLLGGVSEKRAVSDMWQMVNVKRRVDANEEGMGKLSSLVDDLMREMMRLREENEKMQRQMKDMAEMAGVWDKLKALEEEMKVLRDMMMKVQEHINLFPSPETFKNFVTWESLEKALRGIREEMDKMKPPEKVVINMATDPMSRPPSASSKGSGPSEALMEMLEGLGKLNDRHDALEVRVEILEKEMPNKADKKELENLKIPEDLLKRINDMKTQLDNLMAMRNRDNEAMSRIREALTHLQNEMDKLNNLIEGALNDNKDVIKKIQELFNITTDHEGRKADLSYVDERLEPKAEKKLVDSKVNFTLFDETTGNLHKLIDDMLRKLLSSEEELRKLLGELTGELDGKLDRMELDPLKEWLEKRLRALAAKIKAGGAVDMNEDDAAGLRKQMLQHFHCISCDRPIDMAPQSVPPFVPERPGLPSSKSLRPYTTYELDAIRQHARSLGGDVIDVYYTPRACGGSHTTTFPTKRSTKMTNFSNAFPEEEPPQQAKSYREELDLQGVDGHIYKGRVDRLYSAQPQDDGKLPPVPAQQQGPARPQAPGAAGGVVKPATVDRPRSERLTPRTASARARPTSARNGRDSRPLTPGMSEVGPAPTPSLEVPQPGLDDDVNTGHASA